MAKRDIGALTVKELKEILRANGQPVSGKKRVLVSRVRSGRSKKIRAYPAGTPRDNYNLPPGTNAAPGYRRAIGTMAARKGYDTEMVAPYTLTAFSPQKSDTKTPHGTTVRAVRPRLAPQPSPSPLPLQEPRSTWYKLLTNWTLGV